MNQTAVDDSLLLNEGLSLITIRWPNIKAEHHNVWMRLCEVLFSIAVHNSSSFQHRNYQNEKERKKNDKPNTPKENKMCVLKLRCARKGIEREKQNTYLYGMNVLTAGLATG